MITRTCLFQLKTLKSKFLDKRYLVRVNIYRRACSSDSSSKFDYTNIPNERIRNFSIIAHVDHGKSTLADRLLELTGTIKANSGQHQVLDKLQVEKERGITVKAQSVSLLYDYKGEQYLLNLIDTPGHVDFSNEVARSLSACQGVILLVDANDGVQAQTVANFYLAFCKELVIVPVLNKIDLKNADPDRVCGQLQTLFDIQPSDVLKISAKLGTGVDKVLETIVKRLPPPPGDRNAALKALLYDSWFDKYRGVLSLVCIKEGEIKVGDNVSYYHTKKNYEVRSLSILRPQEEKQDKLVAGQIGLIGCNMRSSQEAHIGDTVFLTNKAVEPLPGFKPAVPMVFAGVYPCDQSQHVLLRGAIEKLALNDYGVSVAIETSPALGQGWRLGFLGLLHLEVFSQRLQQEYGAESILTAPSVTYKFKLKETRDNLKKGLDLYISNPTHFPDHVQVEEYYEPMVIGTIIAPDKYIGPIMSLVMDKRGVQKSSTYIDNERVMIQVDLPLCEIVLDFHDKLKTLSSGYASFDYEDNGFKQSYLVKLQILLNSKPVDELSSIVHATKVDYVGRKMVERLKEIIPRQMVHISIQAVVNSRVIARGNLQAYKKDVTAKLHAGDMTRKMKLVSRQNAGKKAMRQVANISIPRDTFIDVLKR